MLTLSMQCSFARGYIAEPYWPQRAKLIDIQKESGMNRARSAANRRKSLEEYLNVSGGLVGMQSAASSLRKIDRRLAKKIPLK